MTYRCPLRSEEVSEEFCNKCNDYYIKMGVKSFIVCVSGHPFVLKDAICAGRDVFCPVCKGRAIPEAPTGGARCCEHILCSICYRKGKTNLCAMSRDPSDARKIMFDWTDIKDYPIQNPKTEEHRGLGIDEYPIAMQSVENQEAVATTDEQFKSMGAEISKSMMALKLLHTGNADRICSDIQSTINRVLKTRYKNTKVRVSIKRTPDGASIDITGDNSTTAWLLHRVKEHVNF